MEQVFEIQRNKFVNSKTVVVRKPFKKVDEINEINDVYCDSSSDFGRPYMLVSKQIQHRFAILMVLLVTNLRLSFATKF